MAEGEHERASREHGRALGEHQGASREHGRAEGEHIDKTGVSRGAKRRGLSQQTVTCCPQSGVYMYININIYSYIDLSFIREKLIVGISNLMILLKERDIHRYIIHTGEAYSWKFKSDHSSERERSNRDMISSEKRQLSGVTQRVGGVRLDRCVERADHSIIQPVHSLG